MNNSKIKINEKYKWMPNLKVDLVNGKTERFEHVIYNSIEKRLMEANR